MALDHFTKNPHRPPTSLSSLPQCVPPPLLPPFFPFFLSQTLPPLLLNPLTYTYTYTFHQKNRGVLYGCFFHGASRTPLISPPPPLFHLPSPRMRLPVSDQSSRKGRGGEGRDGGEEIWGAWGVYHIAFPPPPFSPFFHHHHQQTRAGLEVLPGEWMDGGWNGMRLGRGGGGKGERGGGRGFVIYLGGSHTV